MSTAHPVDVDTDGAAGNARLTSATGLVLLVALFLEGLTLLEVRQLITPHIFIGLLLIPPVAVKLGSTGYRFFRYYAGSRDYRLKGPPPLPIRILLAPLVLLATALLFASGIALVALGPQGGIVLGLHKASFVVWFGAMSLHVLAHFVRIPGLVRPDVRGGEGVGGSRVRLATVAGAVAAGAIAAVATVPLITPWTHWIGGH